MPDSQLRYPHDLAEMADWIRGAAHPTDRILDLGCGDGALVRMLAADGYDVVGVDPHGEPGDRIVSTPVEELDVEPFHVIFASVSLHHLHDPGAASAALARLSAPGATLLVREFDRAVVDHEPTLRWWFHQRHAREIAEPEVGNDPLPKDALPDSFDVFVANWREMMANHVHPWAVVRQMIDRAGFTETGSWSCPYLFRWGLSEDLRPVEERLIGLRTINQVGIRWTGRRSDA